ncbi:hypothetical protein AS890_21390 [Rhizobium anhuiense bv. trifolii]|nr:hypothetical protein AS890_21390 [Rhizobium anhuiense bv. trifolii]
MSDAKPLQIRAHSIQAKFGDQQIGVADFYETTQQTHVAGYAFRIVRNCATFRSRTRPASASLERFGIELSCRAIGRSKKIGQFRMVRRFEIIFPGYFPPHSSRHAKLQFVSQPTSQKQQRLVQAHMLIGPLVVNLRQIRSASAR